MRAYNRFILTLVNCLVGSPWATQHAPDGLESSLMEKKRLKISTGRERQNLRSENTIESVRQQIDQDPHSSIRELFKPWSILRHCSNNIIGRFDAEDGSPDRGCFVHEN